MADTIDSLTAVTWAEANQAYLRTELSRLRLLFRRKVRRLRQIWQQDPLAQHRGLVISDANADRLLSGMGNEEDPFDPEAEESRAIECALKEVEADLAIRRQNLTDAGGIPPPGSAGAIVWTEAIRARCGLAVFRR